MTAYGDAALRAVELWRGNKPAGPIAAWAEAVQEVFPNSKSLREKSCPKSAFLGLCEEGLVSDIPRGKYTRSESNKQYALKAASHLATSPSLANRLRELWSLATDGADTVHNGQMHVVVALLNAKMLNATLRS